MSEVRAALTDANSVVTSVIIIDSKKGWEAPEGLDLHTLPADSHVSPGWSHDGTDFVAPPEPDPEPEVDTP